MDREVIQDEEIEAVVGPPLDQKMRAAARQCLAAILAEDPDATLMWRTRWLELHILWVKRGNPKTSLIACAGGWTNGTVA